MVYRRDKMSAKSPGELEIPEKNPENETETPVIPEEQLFQHTKKHRNQGRFLRREKTSAENILKNGDLIYE